MKKVYPKVKKIINKSIEEAKNRGFEVVKLEHLVISMINDDNNEGTKYLKKLDIDLDKLHTLIELKIGIGEDEEPNQIKVKNISLDKETEEIIQSAEEECNKIGEDFINTHHIVLSLLKQNNFITKIIENMGVNYKKYSKEITNSFGDMPEDDDMENEKPKKKYRGNSATPILDNFSTDVTKNAEEGKIDPVIGRKDEIQRVAQILSRKKKNNPVLIGNPGVGKTTIIEGLALMIKQGEAPRTLLDKRVVLLDLTSMVAGTKYRGQFEERIKGIMDELKQVDDIILFIDELHTLIGTGASAGSMDAANAFKPALAKGEIQIIGATTLDEYRENIEKDGALDRRFQKVIVDPPSLEETREILDKIAESYETYHKVYYPEETIDECVKLADRYITDREFPDKAIDIMDEVGARSQVNLQPPEEIKKMEESVLKIKQEKNDVVKSQRYEEAAKLRDKEREALEELNKAKLIWLSELNHRRIEITPDDVTAVVAHMTGIPLNRISEKEGIRLMKMEKDIGDKVIGQKDAVIKIAKSLRRNKVGIRNPKKPIGSFMFLGPTGVGKTHLAKNLADYMFGDEDSLIRVDMSEYMEKHAVSRLIGAPPGYVGHEEGGQLTEKVRRKPYSIILFDEIEKAHSDVYNVLLQLLDDGQLTDSLGRKVNFKNCMVIMTSNVGIKKLKDFGAGVGFSTNAKKTSQTSVKDEILQKELKNHFPPEFLNRLDDVIIFKSLEKEDISKIVELEIKKLKDRVVEIGFDLQINKTAKDFLIEEGYDEEYGARPLTRAIQKFIEDPVSEEILSGGVKEKQTIKVSYSKAKEDIVVKVE
jgi:ATP-dependent Clp protease ATP-binding subunit ClpC|tara:strand:+ start:3124 stop:5580 length:2457 start_codon:yes stop_codon:yes gene_type:complete